MHHLGTAVILFNHVLMSPDAIKLSPAIGNAKWINSQPPAAFNGATLPMVISNLFSYIRARLSGLSDSKQSR